MSSKVRQEQADLHGQSVQFVRKAERRPHDLARERGREIPLFGPPDGSVMDVHLIELVPGGPAGYYHVHRATDNIYFLLEGSIEVRHAGGLDRLEAGDAVRFPPNVAHAAVIVGDAKAVLLEIYSPAGPDFVKVDEADHVSRDS